MFPPTSGSNLFKWVGIVQRNSVNVLFTTDEFKESNMNKLIPFCFPTKEAPTTQSAFAFRFMACQDTFYNAFCLLDETNYKFKDFQTTSPLCICIVTESFDFEIYEEILKSARSLLSQGISEISKFFKKLYSNTSSIAYINTKLMKAARMVHEKFIMNNTKCITSAFSKETVAELIFSLICETPIIVVSSDLGKMSRFCYALYSLIYPLKWHHLFVPILPNSLIDTVESPSPFIIGLHSSLVDGLKERDIEAHVRIDADECSVEYYNSEPALSWVKQVCSTMESTSFDSIQKTILRFICAALGTNPSSSPSTTARRLVAAKKFVKCGINSIMSRIANSRACNNLFDELNIKPLPNHLHVLLSSCNNGTISPASQDVDEFPLMKARVYRSASAKFPFNDKTKMKEASGIRQSQSMCLNE